MNDDIVTRLHENCGCYAANEFGYNCTNCDAADEIERLRRTLQLMQIDYRTQIAGLKMRCQCGAGND
jgi:hypothetical protein